jgi:hypothetical protein
MIQRNENQMVQFKTSLTESSKEAYGSKRAVLSMMMMMMIMKYVDKKMYIGIQEWVI